MHAFHIEMGLQELGSAVFASCRCRQGRLCPLPLSHFPLAAQGADILKMSDADLLALLDIKLSTALINPGVVRARKSGWGSREARTVMPGAGQGRWRGPLLARDTE